jgi:hypothetical protein
MPRVTLGPEESAFIRERVERFESEAPEGVRRFLGRHVQAHQALPLFNGWTETLAIRADGELVRWTTEEWPMPVQEFDDRTWVQLALVQAAARYPELRQLAPSRPTNALRCETCGGTGFIGGTTTHLEGPICRCGGTGWLLP